MSDDWPQGWYRGEGSGGAPRRPSAQRSGGWGPSAPTQRSSGNRYDRGDDYYDRRPGGNRPGGVRPGGIGGGGRRWRFWGQPGRRGRRILTYFVTLVVVIVIVVVGSYFWLNGKLDRSVTLPTTTTSSQGTNWLITGDDSRSGLSRTEADQMHVGAFTSGGSDSDSIMLLHIGGPGKPVLVSIPRDSYVPIPGHGENKINAALAYGGPALLAQTIESVTGLTINHYMGIGFGGLVSVTNAVGGVNVCLTSAMKDQNSGVNLSAGCHNLNGDQALEFVRDRDSFATGDLQREQDQRAFLSALLKKGMSPGVFLNPFRAYPFATDAASSMSVDKGTSLLDLIQAGMDLQGAQTGTVPISNPDLQTAAGDSVEWNRSEALQLFNALKDNQAVPSGLLNGTTTG